MRSEGYSTWFVILSVCLSVRHAILAVRAINERYHRVKRQICGNIKMAFFIKFSYSKVRAFFFTYLDTNYQCKICWNKALTFGVGSIQLSFRIYHCVHPIHANMFSIYISVKLCHFSAFIIERSDVHMRIRCQVRRVGSLIPSPYAGCE